MTEEEKMLAGMPYDTTSPELLTKLALNKDRIWEYNNIKPSDKGAHKKLLKTILGASGERFIIIPPFYCDFGFNIEVGEDFIANFNFTVLDEAKVRIGKNVFIGPNVGIYTACHPLEPVERNKFTEWSRAVTIGDNVWIGGGVTICPGVTIGNNVTIGAGSVVVKDIADNCVAVGNPAREIKRLEL
ncbi:MAG: sugar O-acetyltransferase [Bacteroidales bacterium]